MYLLILFCIYFCKNKNVSTKIGKRKQIMFIVLQTGGWVKVALESNLRTSTTFSFHNVFTIKTNFFFKSEFCILLLLVQNSIDKKKFDNQSALLAIVVHKIALLFRKLFCQFSMQLLYWDMKWECSKYDPQSSISASSNVIGSDAVQWVNCTSTFKDIFKIYTLLHLIKESYKSNRHK